MAFGIECKHCGQQGTPHDHPELFQEGREEILEGFKVPLKECPGYEPIDKERHDRLIADAKEQHERELEVFYARNRWREG